MADRSLVLDAFTVPEVMARLRLGRSTVYGLIRSRELASFKEGRSRRIPAQSLADYIARKTKEGSS